MKKKILIALIWILIVGFLFSLMPWHRNISVKTVAYEYAMDQEQPLRTHEVTIEGRYFLRFWRENYFDGKIAVSGFDYSLEEPARIQFWKDRDYGFISYRDEYGQPRTKELAQIACSRDFSEFAFLIFELEEKDGRIYSSWDPETGRILCSDGPDYASMRKTCEKLGFTFWEGE